MVLPTISVLWASLAVAEVKLSAIMLRQFLSELLSRSILIGSVSDGVGMHDIVRDFTLGAHTAPALKELQRRFVKTMLAECSAVAEQSNKAAKTVRKYTTSEMTHHMTLARRRSRHR